MILFTDLTRLPPIIINENDKIETIICQVSDVMRDIRPEFIDHIFNTYLAIKEDTNLQYTISLKYVMGQITPSLFDDTIVQFFKMQIEALMQQYGYFYIWFYKTYRNKIDANNLKGLAIYASYYLICRLLVHNIIEINKLIIYEIKIDERTKETNGRIELLDQQIRRYPVLLPIIRDIFLK